MQAYKHIVQYYETDRMGITHHSNYIRWMEEARIDFLKKIGWDYAKLEEIGIISPVVDVTCKYKNTTTFSDEIEIEASVQEVNGVKLSISYVMKKSDGTLVAEANSSHCFLNTDKKLVRIDKQYPDFYNALKSAM